MEDIDLPISGAEVGAATRALSWLARRRKDPVAALKHKQAVRNELRQRLSSGEGESPEVIVVRLGHEDGYPNTDAPLLLPFGASPWFKHEVKGVHDRGLEVVLTIEFVVIRRGKAIIVDEDAPGAIKVFVVGRIPYDRIRHMDWTQDHAYALPRLYTAYGWRGPCSEVVLYEPPSERTGYLYEIPNVKWKGEPSRWKRIKRRLGRVQMAREDRRNLRKLWDEDVLG